MDGSETIRLGRAGACRSWQPTRQPVLVSTCRELMVLIAVGARHEIETRLSSTPSLATARLARSEEFLLTERLAQVYEGDTALHAAAFSYDADLARLLIGRGADVRARNRRGAEPLHAGGHGRTRRTGLGPAPPASRHPLSRRGRRGSRRQGGGRRHPAPSSCTKPLLGRRRDTPGCGCGCPPPKRPRLRSVRPRSLDDGTRRHRHPGGQGRTAGHHRDARSIDGTWAMAMRSTTSRGRPGTAGRPGRRTRGGARCRPR